MRLRPQEQSMWCWAASGQMVMNYFGRDIQQCDEANRRFGRTDCCNSPTPAACNNGGWPEPDRYGFRFRTTSDAPLTWTQVREQIGCRRQPFAFSWHWPGGGGHMMVAFAYRTVSGTNYIRVNDPWAPNVGTIWENTYEVYSSVPGDHTHWNDYYDFVDTTRGD